jgi:hypothetical protein
MSPNPNALISMLLLFSVVSRISSTSLLFSPPLSCGSMRAYVAKKHAKAYGSEKKRVGGEIAYVAKKLAKAYSRELLRQILEYSGHQITLFAVWAVPRGIVTCTFMILPCNVFEYIYQPSYSE